MIFLKMDTRMKCLNYQLMYVTRSNWGRGDVINMYQFFAYGIKFFFEREAKRKSSLIYKREAQIHSCYIHVS